MLNPQPISLRMQRTVLLPVSLLLLAIAVGGVAWLQRADSASAVPVPVERIYNGTATVKIKNGAAWQQFNMQVCAIVETNGPGGDITDVFLVGTDYDWCAYDPGLTIEPPYPSDQCGCEVPPGSFWFDTLADTLQLGGKGWKPNAQKQTANQWLFTLAQPHFDAATVWLNNDDRLMTSGTTLTVKFIRDRGGIYFKVTGFAPLNANGLPKVTVEIESGIGGLDAPPTVVSTSPDWDSENSDVSSDTSFVFNYDEPVNVNTADVGIFCYGPNNPAFFGTNTANLQVTGQGTNTITLKPIPGLPTDGIYSCEAFIDFFGVDDVDTIDPPAFWLGSGVSIFFTTGQPDV